MDKIIQFWKREKHTIFASGIYYVWDWRHITLGLNHLNAINNKGKWHFMIGFSIWPFVRLNGILYCAPNIVLTGWMIVYLCVLFIYLQWGKSRRAVPISCAPATGARQLNTNMADNRVITWCFARQGLKGTTGVWSDQRVRRFKLWTRLATVWLGRWSEVGHDTRISSKHHS